jgi:hypothetical protein
MADWEKIKAEYITKNESPRTLAKKYRVSKDTIYQKINDEDWKGQKGQYKDTTGTKIIEAVQAQEVDRATKLFNASDLLLEKIVAGISAVEIVAPTAAKNYSDALRNIKEIHMIRTAEDIEEQKARIAKLQKETEDSKKEPIRVIIDDTLNDYGK